MLKQTDRDYRSAASAGCSLHSDQLGTEHRPVAHTASNIISFRIGSNFGRGGGTDSLAELEAENTVLRNAAIELALEIQDLRSRGSRAPQRQS